MNVNVKLGAKIYTGEDNFIIIEHYLSIFVIIYIFTNDKEC